MPVKLRQSSDTAAAVDHNAWVAIAAPEPASPDKPRVAGLAAALEQAYDASAETWLRIGQDLGSEPSAGLAHTPACAAHPSDFGLMLAWSHLVRGWASREETVLVMCDDPWLFRHLATLPDVSAGRPPVLWPKRLVLGVRGYLARGRYALRAFAASLRFRGQRRGLAAGSSALLVYGHPASTAEGHDSFFGDMMIRLPELTRVLHVDVGRDQVASLSAGVRTASLHAWGQPWAAMALPFKRWRPRPQDLSGTHAWLVRRAADREGGTGQAAAIAWQNHCQRRWLADKRPAAVAWPWENHAWERDFVRAARSRGTHTIGFQHTVVGRQMLNYGPGSNPDGLESLPDRILCNGPATHEQILSWGMPTERMGIGGGLRQQEVLAVPHDPDAPVFFALPSETGVGRQMVRLAHKLASTGRRVLIKEHPLYPVPIVETDSVQRTTIPFPEQPAVSMVVYAGTTVGLEAILSGIPTLRFRPRGRISLDILPPGLKVETIDLETWDRHLENPPPAPALARERLFADIDWPAWMALLGPAPQGR